MSRLHRRLDRLPSAGGARYIVQRQRHDGAHEPTDDEVRARVDEARAEGCEPVVIRVVRVNARPTA